MNTVEKNIAQGSKQNTKKRHWHLDDEVNVAKTIEQMVKRNSINQEWLDFIFFSKLEHTATFGLNFIDTENKNHKCQTNIVNAEIFSLRSNSMSSSSVLGFKRTDLFNFLKYTLQMTAIGFKRWLGVDAENVKFREDKGINVIEVNGTFEEFTAFKNKLNAISKLFDSVGGLISKKLKFLASNLSLGCFNIKMMGEFINSVAMRTELNNFNIYELIFTKENNFYQNSIEVIVSNFAIDIHDLMEEMTDYFIIFGGFRVKSNALFDVV